MNLSNADFRGARITRANIDESILTGANFEGATFAGEIECRSGCMVDGANLNGVTHEGGDLRFPQADFTGTTFVGAELSLDASNATFVGTDFSDAQLVGVEGSSQFSNGDFSDAVLRNAGLRGVNFENAILTNTDLAGADLTGARLGSADLSGADLSNANVTDVDWLNTVCPNGQNSGLNLGTCCGLLNGAENVIGCAAQ